MQFDHVGSRVYQRQESSTERRLLAKLIRAPTPIKGSYLELPRDTHTKLERLLGVEVLPLIGATRTSVRSIEPSGPISRIDRAWLQSERQQ